MNAINTFFDQRRYTKFKHSLYFTSMFVYRLRYIVQRTSDEVIDENQQHHNFSLFL